MREALAAYRNVLARTSTRPLRGRVLEADSQSVVSAGPLCGVGEACEIRSADGRTYAGEVIAFEESCVRIMLLEQEHGIGAGDAVIALGSGPTFPVGDELLGRVLDARGIALDGGPAIRNLLSRELEAAPPRPFERLSVSQILCTGIKAIDAMLSIGKGQRVGIFGGSGVGKSTLLGMLTRNTAADVVVVGLVGERGREVREFVEQCLGPAGMAHAVVVVATSDESPLLKIRAAQGATAIAEHFASEGRDVLLIVDSLTRSAMAMRQLGLAAHEPPTNKGYTPSVFSKLARLIERSGRFQKGSISAIYTVLMEGDDQQDPVVDAVRSFVDGHIVLSRELALSGWYPPIDVLSSISRLMPALVAPAHAAHATKLRQEMASYAQSEDLLRIGAYKAGADPFLDRAVANRQAVAAFLQQNADESVAFSEIEEALKQLVDA